MAFPATKVQQRALWLSAIVCLSLLSLSCGGGESAPRERRVTVELKSFESVVRGVGSIEAQPGAEVKVGPQVSGLLRRVAVSVGDAVRSGDLLAELDTQSMVATVDKLAAQVRASQADLIGRQWRLSWIQRQYARRRELAVGGLVSHEDMESIEQQVAEAKAAVDLASASLDAARADLKRARIELSHYKIRSPIDGTVMSISTQEGETVAASFAIPTFMTIVDLSRLQLNVLIDEVDIMKVEPNQDVSIQLDSSPEQLLGGHVKAVSPEAIVRNSVVYYLVIVEGQWQSVRLRPKMTATAEISTGNTGERLVVPSWAISFDGSGVPYLRVSGDQAIETRRVAIGPTVQGYTVLLQGAKEGEIVVVKEEESQL